MPQEGPVLAHDQHVDDVETDHRFGFEWAVCQPGCSRDFHVVAGDLAALEAAFAVFGGSDVDEGQDALVDGDQVDGGSLGRSPAGLEEFEVLVLDEACGCLDSPLLKFGIAHDDLRLFAASPFGMPCDPEAAQVLAEGKEKSEDPEGHFEFCVAKVFRAFPGSAGF